MAGVEGRLEERRYERGVARAIGSERGGGEGGGEGERGGCGWRRCPSAGGVVLFTPGTPMKWHAVDT